jgi:Acyl-CoA dehydrogenase, N-terminal domain/Acyl-CoA dehydrogenase, middle domain
MPDFTLTEEQRNIRELAHDFAEKEIRPVAWDYDRDATWPRQIIEKAWRVGLMNPQLDEQYGGAGASYLDGVLIGEELAWGCAAIATTLGINELAATPVLLGGSDQIKSKYLGMLAEEAKLASFCLTEPDAGSDVSAMRTTAVRRGDKYVINGSKAFISNGGYADWYTVYAKTDSGMTSADRIDEHGPADRDGPLLICYDGSEDAKHAIKSAGALLAARPALVLTVREATAPATTTPGSDGGCALATRIGWTPAARSGLFSVRRSTRVR